MTTVRMLPVHEIVRRTFPRPPPTEKDEVAMAIGQAIDGALSAFGYELRLGRRPTQTAIGRRAETLLDEALAEAAVTLAPPERAATLEEIADVVRAYRRSELAGLARPRTRVLLLGEEVGVYAQPDYWDGRRRIYEMKSYRAVPPPPDVALQLRLFQLAYPGFEAVLVCLDRHTRPVETTSWPVPPPTDREAREALRRAYLLGQEFGETKVLDYVEGPFARYAIPPDEGGPSAPPSAP